MRTISLILAFLCLINLSCKKKTAETVSDPPESSCVCLKENIGGSPGNQVPCSGYLSIITYTDLTKEKAFSFSQEATAFFNNSSSPQPNGNFVTVDSVLLDEQLMPIVNDANNEPMYYSTNLSRTSQQRWTVYGAHAIPSFTFTADLKDPAANFSSVPDQINKSIQKSFPLNGVTNIAGGTLILLDASGKTHWNISVIIRPGSNEVCFPEDQLKLLGPGKATLLIILENWMVVTDSSKSFLLSKKLQYTKDIILNP